MVESRRNTGYDTQLAPKSEGLIAYVVDTTIPYTKSGMWLVPAPDSKDAVWRRDAALASGQRITYGGWTVEVLESGEFGELVSIRREE